MKITYIELKNFSNINTAFGTDTISIDFTLCKNKVILFTGKNGSGKTSILSCLHPFATNGNLDIRNDNPLVIKGKNGYKEIHIIDDTDEYVIKHYYTASKETHIVKSYIIKNNIELNPNGNVTSFKEIIKDELEIELDYLKLTRLGSNVTNFIDLKTTERKSFMGKILDEVDVYLKYYKKVNNDMREIKSIISHTIDKISKLSIGDEDELVKYQKSLKKEVNKYSELMDDYKSQISILVHDIMKYPSLLILKDNISTSKKDLDKMNKILANNDLSLDECVSAIADLEKTVITIESEITIISNKRKTLLEQLDKNIAEVNDISKELDKINNSQDIKDTEYMIKELKEKIEARSKECNLIDFNPSYTKKDIETLITSLDNSNEIMYTTYEFGIEPIKRALEYIESNESLSSYVNTNKKKVTKNRLQSACEIVYNSMIEKYGNITHDCKNPNFCKVMSFYKDISDIALEIPDEIVEDDVFVSYVKIAYNNINTIINNIKDHKDVIDKLPEDIKEDFILKNLSNKIKSSKAIYNKEKLYSHLSLISEYELQESDLKYLKELKSKLSLLKKSISNVDYLTERLDKLTSENDDIDENINENTEKIASLNNKLANTKRDLDSLHDLKKTLEMHDTLQEDFDSYVSDYDISKKLIEEKQQKQIELNDIEYRYNKSLKTFNDNEYRLTSYKALNDELSSYSSTYDEMNLIKNSLSAKEGIPLLYIQIYLKGIQDITNELLEKIYEDELYIEDFNITADEFKIPYNTKNTSIKDVSYASQGEKSFISLALSFALIYQSISKYNIMLLDEIDATLDTSNREKFLQILETQLDMIDAEQLFLISHNNMFNTYPVDIVDTGNNVASENKLANYIKIKRK